jgi:hypothetical protein
MPLMKKGEKVILEESGVWIGSKIAKGTATLTNQRLLVEGQVGSFLAKRTETFLDVPLDHISNIRVQKGFLKGNAIIVEVPVDMISSSIKGALPGSGFVSGQLQGFALSVRDPDDWYHKVQSAISEG